MTETDQGVHTTGVDPQQGLTAAQVEQRRAQGRGNEAPSTGGRSVAGIVRDNVFTRINALLGGLYVLVMMTGQWLDGLFAFAIVANSVVGVVQEVRAKRTLDRLTI